MALYYESCAANQETLVWVKLKLGKQKAEIGKIKRNAEAGRAPRQTLSWILKVWSADL